MSINNTAASASVDLIRAKATQLKRLLLSAAAAEDDAGNMSDVEMTTRQCRSRLDTFFDEAIRRLEQRRSKLQTALDRRLLVAGVGAEQELLAKATAVSSAGLAEATSSDLLHRLDEAIALRERPSIDGGIDLAEAERRARRLLDCLQLDWSCHEEGDGDGEDQDWLRQRRADDPFAADWSSPATAPEAALTSVYGQLPMSSSIDFSRVLSSAVGPERSSAADSLVSGTEVSALDKPFARSVNPQTGSTKASAGVTIEPFTMKTYGKAAGSVACNPSQVLSTGTSTSSGLPSIKTPALAASVPESQIRKPSLGLSDKKAPVVAATYSSISPKAIRASTATSVPISQTSRPSLGLEGNKTFDSGNFSYSSNSSISPVIADSVSSTFDSQYVESHYQASHFSLGGFGSTYYTSSFDGSVPYAASSYSVDFRDIIDCRTMAAPTSLTFVHDMFYTVEGGCIRKYRWQDGRCLGKLTLTAEDGNTVDLRPFCVRSCGTNDWLLIVDFEGCRVLCVDSDSIVRMQVGPRISAKYSLENPVQAVSSGTYLFICCPEQAIFFVRISDGRSVTQTKEHLGLTRPIRLAWSQVTSRLIVMDDKGESPFTIHTFDVTGGGIGGLSKANNYYVNFDSDCEPDLVCLPESDHVILIADSAKVMQFENWLFYEDRDYDPMRPLCESDDWKRLSDICVISKSLVAVCDKKARWIRILHTE